MATLKRYLRYAWHGRRDIAEWVLAVFGGGLFGGYFLLTGQSVPVLSDLHENLFLADAAVLLLSVLAARLAIFLARLAWSPIHFALEPQGGLVAVLRRRLGADMWPFILMGSGIAAFVFLFGAGMIWAGVNGRLPAIAGQNATSSYDVERQLRAIDSIREFVITQILPLSGEGYMLDNRVAGRLTEERESLIHDLNTFADKVDEPLKKLDGLARLFNAVCEIIPRKCDAKGKRL